VLTNKIILGTVQFGLDYGINNARGRQSPKQIFEILEEALQNDIKVLDTADAYGDASKIIGAFHHESKQKFVVNTKFTVDQKKSISNQAHQSLETLNINFIEVYFFHRFNDMIEYPETGCELEKLKKEGIIKKIGASIYDNKQFEKAILSDFIEVIQLPFNLLDNISQRGMLLKLAKEKNKEIQARSVFLQGLFFKSIDSYPIYLEPLKKYVYALNSIKEETCLDMNQLAMAYALSQSNVDYVIIGVDSCEQLRQNISNAQFALTSDIKQKIDQISVEDSELLYPYNWK
jgi:aryl-alcohol dehydrogenase-like predicted oxidoreductase